MEARQLMEDQSLGRAAVERHSRWPVSVVIGHPDATPIGGGIAVKDSIAVEGAVQSCGSRALASAVAATQDAAVVKRLKRAGYAIVARANMHELAYGVTGLNSWAGTPTNPAYPALIPGGSSSGSAVAVAAGLVDFALGTDTGGSVRVPATCCAVVGLKPSFGRISRDGVQPAVSSLDCVGVLGRDVQAVERAMSCLVEDWRSSDLTIDGAKLAWFAPSGDPEINAFVRSSAATTFDLADINLPEFDAAGDAGLAIIGRETWEAFGHLTKTGQVGRDVHDRLLASSKITDCELAQAEATRVRFREAVDCLLETHEAIALPAMTCPVPSLLEATGATDPRSLTFACRPFNLSGHPAIALPVGEIGGRPVSLQIVGRVGGDEGLCGLARKVKIFTKGEA